MALDQRGADDPGLVGRIIAGGFRITQRTGSTPQGPLYEAEDPEGHRVVLLILPARPGQEPAGVRFFRMAARIRHPNVASVQALGDLEDGSVYVILEVSVGEPLLNVLGARSSLSIGEALELILQVAAGLQAVHEAGFVHGNVSPSTIVVTRAPFGKSQVKLVGFNMDSDRHRPTKLEPGSAPYASPERLRGTAPDPRCDVFSVAAVLHHLLTGSPPDEGRTAGNLPRLARPVLEMALARAPGARYRTMSDFREALEALSAAAVTPPEELAYRKILGRAIVAGLVLMAGGVLLAPVWRSVAESPRRAPAPAALPAPKPSVASADSAVRSTEDRARRGVAAERRQSTQAGRAAPSPRVRPGARGGADAEASAEPPREEPIEPPETAGYVGEGSAAEPLTDRAERPAPPPRRASASTPLTPRPPPPRPPRTRAVLDQDPGLRLAIGDVTRVGLAENVVETQLGLLVVDLAPDGMSVPSASYNLQRLYLAYSAATDLDTVAVELRRQGRVYAWFTRVGLRYASEEADRR
jgi:serine/threonine-protein kinase